MAEKLAQVHDLDTQARTLKHTLEVKQLELDQAQTQNTKLQGISLFDGLWMESCYLMLFCLSLS